MVIILKFLQMLLILCFFFIGFFTPNIIRNYIKKKKQKKCFNTFFELFPLSSLCPGKKNSLECHECPHFMDNFDYNVEKLSDKEISISEFNPNNQK